MKKNVFLLMLAVLISSVFAAKDGSMEGYWPKSYYAELGMGMTASKGDMSERILKLKSEDGEKETVHPAALNLMGSPNLALGANIAQFSLEANFMYWQYVELLGGFPTEDVEDEVRMLRVGFNVIYNFFFPDFFQAGAGLGYSYYNIKTTNNVFDSEANRSNSELMGSAFNIVLNMRYYISDNFALVPAIKIYEAWFHTIYTDKGGTCDLSSNIWQTFVSVEMNLHFQF
ncbi:MAG: outer membrane beta-barrel protein [Fibrobacteraceae bacterium]|mgnify:CR=1 FL=1|nr:outer membrane beta-barrel protein [Fibrobacteraceae bacterium]